jgi:hypothetical protein
MKSPNFVAVMALALVVVAACSGSGPAPTGAGTPTAATTTITTTPAPTVGTVDACALLTPAELKTVTGGDYTGPGVSNSVGQCNWSGGGTSLASGHSFVVATIGDNPLAAIKGTFPGGVDLTVSGHAGYWNPLPGFQAICVDLGGRTLILTIDPAGADGQAVAQKLAEIAVARM